MEETKAINMSLLALKECIQARTLAATPGQGHTHVPYRRSKLTLLLKDVFDIACTRLSATVVIATLSPLAGDAAQTANTLKYAAPFREAVGLFGMKAKTGVTVEKNTRDPALWTAEELAAWLATVGVSPLGVSGAELCAMPEPELFRRVGDSSLAQKLHTELWALIVAAKTHKRRADGTLLTDEQEKIEAEAAKAAKEAAWAAREAERAERRAKEEEDRDAQ
jgi:kinesin family protein 2/24